MGNEQRANAEGLEGQLYLREDPKVVFETDNFTEEEILQTHYEVNMDDLETVRCA